MSRILGIIFLLAGAGLIGFGINMLDREPPELELPADMEGVIVESPPEILLPFTLQDHTGKPFTNDSLEGKWSLMFFGYTNCPDVCPTSMGVMSGLSKKEDLKDFNFIFATVDPQRDTVEKIADFVGFFDPRFIGLTGEKAEIDKFRDTLGIIYDFEGDTKTDDYIVTHFAALYLFDPRGRMRAYVLPPHDIKRVYEAVKLVHGYYEAN